jgi:tetratricopeptide (TPR) repeat protein
VSDDGQPVSTRLYQPHPSQGGGGATLPTPRSRPITSTLNAPAIGLTDALQSFAQQRRDGVVTIDSGESIHLVGGQVVAVGGLADGSIARALLWTGRIDLGSLAGVADIDLPERVVASGLMTPELLRDALSVLLEEEFCRILLAQHPDWDFIAEAPPDPVATTLRGLGLSVPVQPLLMEAMRRRDEQSQLAPFLLDTWDLPVPNAQTGEADGLTGDAARLLANCDGEAPAWVVIDRLGRPGWSTQTLLAQLIQAGWLRTGDADELHRAGQLWSERGEAGLAEGLLERSLQMNADNGRAHAALAALLLARGATEEAVTRYQLAASMLMAVDPHEALHCLELVLAHGGEAVAALRQRIELHRHLGDNASAIADGWRLLEHFQTAGRHGEALALLRELARIGADTVTCLRATAAVAAAAGARDEALTAWEALERRAADNAAREELIDIRQQILLLDPGRLATAIELARMLQAGGQAAEAAVIVRNGLLNAHQAPAALMITAREILAACDPGDVANRRILANAYQQRADRGGAIEQLRRLVVDQLAGDDQAGLMESLQRLHALDPTDMDAVRHLGALLMGDGRTAESERVWQEGVQAAMAAGDAARSLALVDEALLSLPYSVPLRLLAVRCANRLSRRAEAVRHCLAAARLARIGNDGRLALQCLHQLLPLRREDVHLHAELVGVAEETDGANLSAILDDAINAAMETGNLGLAVGWSRQRIALLPGDDLSERRRLLHCLHRSDQHLEAVQLARVLVDDLVHGNRVTEARVLLDELIAWYPQAGDFALRQGRLLRDHGDRRAARTHLERAVALLAAERRSDEALQILREVAPLEDDRNLLHSIRDQIIRNEPVHWGRA